ncbi:heat shock 22 kDa protein, chloroplastic-like [Salvia miltiorrhiza]|uniref:heat shock 22 kDa protein, chloroplastic-like n=1 Tax=Salvia miltiorrhiza TaxID=226208 RepID=UPI0025AD3C73|nr:heat shock 22 kDa protein, chloroplastic-like [Salvia miltiorrhiza]
MESQAVRRRANVIAAHLASHEDISATATHVFPMRCSNSLNSVIRRYDNRMYFARQGSDSQGYHMRQAINEQGNYVQPSMPSQSTDSGKKGSTSLDAPSYARPARVEPGLPPFKSIDASEGPVYARPTREEGKPVFNSMEKARNVAQTGSEWSPRMDVVESGFNYVITLEIPGVSNDNVKVEVDDQSLVISGNRLNRSCGALCSNKPIMTYHRREISRGPYRIVWPLPSNTMKDNVSAEIQDGLLRVTIPKLSGLRWLRKAYM